jgi:Protein of unknown function (DUF664)
LPPYRILPLPGYAPTIGRLVAMLSYARQTTLEAVEGLTREQLDHLQDDRSNSIGALLAHVAAVERGYQLVTFEEREPSAAENDAWSAALKLGNKGAPRDPRSRAAVLCRRASADTRGYARGTAEAR